MVFNWPVDVAYRRCEKTEHKLTIDLSIPIGVELQPIPPAGASTAARRESVWQAHRRLYPLLPWKRVYSKDVLAVASLHDINCLFNVGLTRKTSRTIDSLIPQHFVPLPSMTFRILDPEIKEPSMASVCQDEFCPLLRDNRLGRRVGLLSTPAGWSVTLCRKLQTTDVKNGGAEWIDGSRYPIFVGHE